MKGLSGIVETIRVRKDDLQLILDGLDEHWVTYPEHQPAIERLQQAVDTPRLPIEEWIEWDSLIVRS